MRRAVHPAAFLGGAILLCVAWLWLEPWAPTESAPTRHAPRSAAAQRASIVLDTAVLERYVGRYRGRGDFTVEVTRKDRTLFAQATGTIPFEMSATSRTEFFLPAVDVDVTFRLDRDGAVRGFVADTEFGIIEADRVR
jgi:hypothetical protein